MRERKAAKSTEGITKNCSLQRARQSFSWSKDGHGRSNRGHARPSSTPIQSSRVGPRFSGSPTADLRREARHLGIGDTSDDVHGMSHEDEESDDGGSEIEEEDANRIIYEEEGGEASDSDSDDGCGGMYDEGDDSECEEGVEGDNAVE